MDGVVFGLTEQHLDQIILILAGAAAAVVIILAFRAKAVHAWGLKLLLGKQGNGNGKHPENGYKPPCGGKNAPEVATAKELKEVSDKFVEALEAHDNQNKEDFSRLEGKIENLRKDMHDLHRTQTDRIIKILLEAGIQKKND